MAAVLRLRMGEREKDGDWLGDYYNNLGKERMVAWTGTLAVGW